MPRGDALQLGGPFAANVVKVLGWANDPAIAQANIVTVLVSEGLHDLNALVVENPACGRRCTCRCRTRPSMLDYVQHAGRDGVPDARGKSEVPVDTLGDAADRA